MSTVQHNTRSETLNKLQSSVEAFSAVHTTAHRVILQNVRSCSVPQGNCISCNYARYSVQSTVRNNIRWVVSRLPLSSPEQRDIVCTSSRLSEVTNCRQTLSFPVRVSFVSNGVDLETEGDAAECRSEESVNVHPTLAPCQYVVCLIECPPPGHNLPQTDGNSTEAESASGTTGRTTQVGCYRNFDHFPSRHRRSNSSQPAPSLPIAAGPDGGLSNPPPPPQSPPPSHLQSQQLLLDLPPVAQLGDEPPPGAQTDEQQPLTRSPEGYTSPVSRLDSLHS